MPKFYMKQGSNLFIYLKPVVALLASVAVLLMVILCVNGIITKKAQDKASFAGLSKKQIAQLTVLDEYAGVPGAQEARDAVEEYERKQEIKQQKWIAAQKKRVAAAKKKAAEEEEEKRLKKIEKIAQANTDATYSGTYNGAVLSKSAGTVMGPSGKETYYNLDMSVCVRIMRNMGFSEADYPYAVRSDGVKTLGGFVMCAANLSTRPKGSYIMTSLGVGIVVDTGTFARSNPTQLDICVNW